MAACRPRACCPRSCCCYPVGSPAPPLRSWLGLSVTLIRESTGNESISETEAQLFALATVPVQEEWLEQGESFFFSWKLKSHFSQSAIHYEVSSISGMKLREQGTSETSTTGKKWENFVLVFRLGPKSLTKRRHFRCSETSAAARTGGRTRPPLAQTEKIRFLQRPDEIQRNERCRVVWTRLDQRGALTTGGRGTFARRRREGRRARAAGTRWVGAAPEVLVGGDGGGEAESREGRGA